MQIICILNLKQKLNNQITNTKKSCSKILKIEFYQKPEIFFKWKINILYNKRIIHNYLLIPIKIILKILKKYLLTLKVNHNFKCNKLTQIKKKQVKEDV